MAETVIVLKPHDEWHKKPRWYSEWVPERLQKVLRHAWPDRLSTHELIYGPGGMNEALQLPGIHYTPP